MKRQARLASARSWLTTFRGKNVVRGYANWFGVDLLCAVEELSLCAIAIDPIYVAQLKATFASGRRRPPKQPVAEPQSTGYGIDWDENSPTLPAKRRQVFRTVLPGERESETSNEEQVKSPSVADDDDCHSEHQDPSFRSAAGAPQIVACHHAAKFDLSDEQMPVRSRRSRLWPRYKGQDLTLGEPPQARDFGKLMVKGGLSMALITVNGVIGKVCKGPVCNGQWKPLNDFPTDPSHGPSQGGRHCRCRACHRKMYRLRKKS
jgi:hypothetical protein